MESAQSRAVQEFKLIQTRFFFGPRATTAERRQLDLNLAFWAENGHFPDHVTGGLWKALHRELNWIAGFYRVV